MHETGIENYYAIRDGKKLYYGYTTGTCAAAAAKAAALMLATGRPVPFVDILTPKGIALNLEVLEAELGSGHARCAVRKYSGDDPDVTNGILVFADVTLEKTPGVLVDGGAGVGRVTKPGLKQAVGEAAINPVPLRMIREEAERVAEDYGLGGLKVIVSIPAGIELAKRTFNPRLGIVGGISVLGTSGIVEPMSCGRTTRWAAAASSSPRATTARILSARCATWRRRSWSSVPTSSDRPSTWRRTRGFRSSFSSATSANSSSSPAAS